MSGPFDYDPPGDLLRGKIILVTGASSGLGRAAACAYARYGATVLLLGRREEALNDVYDEIEHQGLPQPAVLLLDLATANDNSFGELAVTLRQEFGRLDGVLHSAALGAQPLPLEHLAMETWNRLLHVNLTAGYALTRHCLPLLRAAAHASVVFTTCAAGHDVRAYQGAYTIAKHGVENLVTLFHEELASTSRIRVNALNPGPCATALRRVAFPAEDPARLRQPAQLMAPYLYLMGDDSLGVSGQRLDAR
jgi:NAD(P)-dependent dehydrogenase (short-subunit alcohol dehydrogenase family)